MSELYPHIGRDEYACKDCGELPPDFYTASGEIADPYVYLFDAFGVIRDAWGGPLRISSGYRCIKYNAQVGGEGCSAHMFGLALDLDVKDNAEVEKLARICELEIPEFRRGEYRNGESFVHIDCAYLMYPRPTEAFRRGVRWFK
jgi:uncharacterized protein YcbK (DUF882 family)